MARREIGIARHQPPGRDAGQHREVETAAAAAPGLELDRRGLELVQQRLDAPQVRIGRRRERQSLAFTHEQQRAEFVLQGLDELADRALRHAQLVGRAGEAVVPGTGLEREQARKGGRVGSHSMHERWSSTKEEKSLSAVQRNFHNRRGHAAF